MVDPKPCLNDPENLPIPLNLVPYQISCPALHYEQRQLERQGKGITNHKMPLGDWFDTVGPHFMSLIGYLEF